MLSCVAICKHRSRDDLAAEEEEEEETVYGRKTSDRSVSPGVKSDCKKSHFYWNSIQSSQYKHKEQSSQIIDQSFDLFKIICNLDFVKTCNQ